MIFAKRVFFVAGIYGLVVVAPQFFLEQRVGIDYPPAVTHPEFYYGFLGVALAWQIAFLILATDPARYRPMMIPSVLEKLSFGVAAVVLYLQGRVAALIVGFGCVDLLFAAFFVAAFCLTAPRCGPPRMD